MIAPLALHLAFAGGIMNDKTVKPPYPSFRLFDNFKKELGEHAVLPAVIDRSYLSKRSGSDQSSIIATLKWFGLTDDNGVPTERLRTYVKADDEQVKTLLRQMMEESYSFMTDGSINLLNATTSQMSERFRQYEISGSTLTKSIAFFLAAAKEAGIQVSPHIKPPTTATNGAAKKKPKAAAPAAEQPTGAAPLAQTHQHSPPQTGMIHIPIPIFGKSDGAIYLPDNMDAPQWNSVIKMTEFILKNYRNTMAHSSDDAAIEEDEDQ